MMSFHSALFLGIYFYVNFTAELIDLGRGQLKTYFYKCNSLTWGCGSVQVSGHWGNISDYHSFIWQSNWTKIIRLKHIHITYNTAFLSYTFSCFNYKTIGTFSKMEIIKNYGDRTIYIKLLNKELLNSCLLFENK